MKLFSFGVIVIPLLCVANSYCQNTIKDQLMSLEESAITAKSEVIVYTIDGLKSANSYDFIGLNACQSLDTLMVFVAEQKQIAATTFESNIKPYLEKKLVESNMKTLDFTDEEDPIYESFIKVLNFKNAIPIVQLYEEFILKNYKNKELMSNILTLLSYIKYACFYLLKEVSDPIFKYTNHCFREDVVSYNALNWKVFAMHPGAMLFWTIAACAWDAKFEK